jgi:type VI secretion system secreted protein VgrG
MEIFDYPGGYDSNADGDDKSKLRMEEKEHCREILQGAGYCRAFRPGFKFCLKEHDRDDMNQDYILKEVSHSATQKEYSNSFLAFVDGKPFRPAKNTAIPVIFGAQTAIVVGPGGEEIYTDQLGRIKIQFHWDRKGENDEKSSCWIRVAQGMAGQGWGGCFLPRIGQEVVVSFLEGNPDRPLVTGAVYNGDNATPLALPDEATRSTIKTNSSKGGEGSNEIRFEDLADSEELYFHAQKDMNIAVENDYSSNILHDETHVIKNDRSLTVQEGNETLAVTEGNRSRTVGGDESVTVSGGRTLKIDSDETHTNGAAFTQKVSGDFILDVSGSITIKAGGSVTIEAGQSFTEKAGMDFSCTAGTSIDQKAGTALTNEAGTSLTNKAEISLTNQASMSLTNDGGLSLTNKGDMVTNDAGMNMTCKGGLMNSCEGGVTLSLKGPMLKLN